MTSCRRSDRLSRLAILFTPLVLLLLPTLLAAQISDSNRVIIDRLDALELQNRQLLEEIKALRALLTARAGASRDQSGQPQSDASAPSLEDRADVTEHRVEELAQTKVEASQRFPVKLTGTLLFNAFHNGGFSGGAQDPTVAATTYSSTLAGASFRQTVLGLTFNGPRTVFGGALSGSAYMDFFAGSNQSLNHLLRLRVATIQIDWPTTTFAVGQDKPLVSRREPNSLAQVGVSPLTGAGNPWLWQPQARLEQRFQLTDAMSIKAEGGVFQTAETAGQPSLIAGNIEPARPSLETRAAFRYARSDDHFFEVGSVMHFSTSHIGGQSVDSRLYGADWLVKPLRQLEMTGLAFRGRNFANLGALGGISMDANGRYQAIRGAGGWLQVRYFPTGRLTFDFYGGLQDDRKSDLSTGNIGRNHYLAGNVMYLLAPNVIGAFEFGQNRTTYLGDGKRLNNHYDLALGYLF